MPPPPSPSSSLLPTTHYSKTKKPRHHLSTTTSSSSTSPLLLFSIVSILIGVAGVAIAAAVLLRPPRTVTVFRCGRAEDSFRTFQAKKGVSGDAREVVGRPKLLGFVGIQTGFESAKRRRALRSTWFPAEPDALQNLEHATGLAFRFVIGKTRDAKKMAELKKEEEIYHDFMFINAEEEYAKLPYKTLAFFKAAFNLFEAEFYVKMDDDVYLRPDRLATLLAKDRPHSFTYIGCMKNGPVVKDPKLKWYESQGHLMGSDYFLHAYGPIYSLSAEVVSTLAAAKIESLRMFSNEDVTIGSWMLAMNVTHEDNNAFCQSQCTPTSIAVWDIPKCSGLCNPENKLKELHNNTMCSKSPTVPPEEDTE